jgi:RNA polymerase sigma-70 factor (ECF subfamily)
VACGLTTSEIARAFLVPEKTLGQRIFRAKKTLSEAHVPFEIPRGDDLRKRVESVLSVVYLIFNEGYTATSGEEWMRTDTVRGRAAAWAHPRGSFFPVNLRSTVCWR